MTISVSVNEAKKLISDLEDLLKSYHLSRPEELIEEIEPYWQGSKADNFKKKYAEIKENLSANIARAELFCIQANESLSRIVDLDNQ